MFKKLRFFLICGALLLLVSGCGDKSALKSDLENVSLTKELPSVRITDCRRLADADDEVYEQQLAACEMYYEAYDITRTTDYIEKYEGEVKKKRVAYYCNLRRKELQLDVATQLNDNVYAMIRSVEDCENIAAYLKRVNYDAVNFYDYYMAYVNSGGDIDSACEILTVFYERSNVLAFRFMDEHKEDLMESAITRIIENSLAMEDFNVYIARNNELIKALNTVYGGVPGEYAEQITTANTALVRKMLEFDNDLSEKEIDSLMEQLGEPTPTPEPTPEPTEEPTPTPEPTPEPERITEAPLLTPAPVPRTPAPVRTQAPAVNQPAAIPTPEVYMFGD